MFHEMSEREELKSELISDLVVWWTLNEDVPVHRRTSKIFFLHVDLLTTLCLLKIVKHPNNIFE